MNEFKMKLVVEFQHEKLEIDADDFGFRSAEEALLGLQCPLLVSLLKRYISQRDASKAVEAAKAEK